MAGENCRPDDGVSFNDTQLQHYEKLDGIDFGHPPFPQHYQDPAREHEATMDQLKRQHESARRS